MIFFGFLLLLLTHPAITGSMQLNTIVIWVVRIAGISMILPLLSKAIVALKEVPELKQLFPVAFGSLLLILTLPFIPEYFSIPIIVVWLMRLIGIGLMVRFISKAK